MSQAPSHLGTDIESLPFHSILFGRFDLGAGVEDQPAPEFFRDLNLDQVVASITESWQDYNLTPFFYTRLSDLDAVSYRQEIMEDFSDGRLMRAVNSFSGAMRAMREHLNQAKDLYYQYAIERAFLGAAEIYWQAAQELSSELTALDLNSRGLRAFRKYLTDYVNSSFFERLVADGQSVITDLSNITYSLQMKDDSITVRHYDGENDYSIAAEETFAKFCRQNDNDHREKVPVPDSMNHIQAQVLDATE
jgi:DNA mismatch repair protein MutS